MIREPFPIRPTALTIENFRGWRGRHELELDGDLTLLVGPNGSGKSGMLNAIEWCLFGGEVAKKSSGIDERGEWEIAHRQSAGRVSVTLLLSVEGGTARLVRARPVNAKPRDPDVVRLELSDEEVLEGYEVTDWMSWNGLPDWSDWKNSFCQHQELLRGRVTDSGERSAQLGALLGLEEYKKVNDRLKALRAKDLAKVAQTELATIEDELKRSLERPGRELRELEDRLEQRGIARTEIGEPILVARTERLLAEGQRIAELLDLQAPLPDSAVCTQEEVLGWARDWEPQVNLRRGEIERELGTLRLDLQELEGAIGGIEPARRRWQDARAAWKRWTEEHGSAEDLEQQLGSLRREREELRDQERQHDAMRQLLRQATEAMSGREADGCPVCGHQDPSLVENLRRRLEDGDDPLKERFEALDGRERRLQEQRAKLAQLQSELELAESAHQGLQKNLEARLPAGGSEATGSLEEFARQQRVRIAEAQGVLRRIEEHLGPHRANTEALELLLKWRAARARADAATGDLGSIEAWNELQDAIDEAAGLVCDIEALGRLAREAQEARSGARVKEVNRSLGRHFGRISGRAGDEGVRVVVKSTATRLDYLLVDGKGENITSILNQAALNALSFAMLFARAEERAKQGLPQWLVLDDPGQSLDQNCLAGLADAVAEVSGRTPVLIATYPGALATTLEHSSLANRRIFHLSPNAGSDESTIREVRP